VVKYVIVRALNMRWGVDVKGWGRGVENRRIRFLAW